MINGDALLYNITFIGTVLEPAETYKFLQIGSEKMEWENIGLMIFILWITLAKNVLFLA